MSWPKRSLAGLDIRHIPYKGTVAAIPDLLTKFADLGFETIGGLPAELTAVIKSEIPTWAKAIKEAGIKAD